MGHFITGEFATIGTVGDERNNMANGLDLKIDGVKSDLTDFRQKPPPRVYSMRS